MWDRQSYFKIYITFNSVHLSRKVINEIVGKYIDWIPSIVNNIRLLGDDFLNKKIVEKVLVTLSEMFESKISSLEESKEDLNIVSLGELMSVLEAQEQKRSM